MKWCNFFNKISLILQALGCAVLYFVIEAICRHSFTEAWTYMTTKPLVFAYNAAFIFTTMLIVYLFRKRIFWRIFIGSLWLFLGIVNGVLLLNRVTPFTGPDVKNLTDGLSIAKKYLTHTQMTIGAVFLGLAVIILLIILIRSPKYRGKLKYKVNIPLVLAGILAFGGITQLALEKRVLSNYFGNIAIAYEDYGYPYCLATTIFNTGISAPRDYSEKEISRIEKTEENLPATKDGSHPNILFLQLESFFDPTLVNYLDISEDPIPNFRKLMEEYSSGYYKVPSVGAGTANTEFESITGMSLHYFGPGEYPYKSILKETTCESAPYVLKNLGYTAHAVHNNEANFYGRRSIFPNLGFDTFTSAEYMKDENQKNPLGWTKDSVLTDEIVKCLDSTEGPDYVYTISVQGHGDYPSEPVLENPEITVSGAPTDELNNKWEYYVNQIHEMDNFVKELTDRLADYPEDVVLVMYGDHLPTMGLTVEDVDNKYLFQTEYVMWDNFGLKKKKENLAAYQMAAEVMDRVGIHEGNIFKYHQARRNTKNYQVDLETLQYDLLYGKQYTYDEKNPFERTKMHMGIYDTTLESIQVVSETDHTYYIQGTNFTPSSQVKINGEWYDTVYVNPTKLIITGKELDDFDRLSVVQRSNSSTRKAMTKSHDRAVYALLSDSRWKLDSEKNASDTAEAEESDTAETAAAETSGGENSTESR
ncbi:LTA synthase family protein [Blautia schinkii]|uniref:LTA synthase family protein n=2 Tax=Blautia schinkii TaxID=180164 RepID=UPI00156E7C90|nr:LTA synthase family protein [Blautia schinkii]NSG81807.1 LTA synthase family protein [Blautia schinkii]NSK22408.1 LTA synthase family protein [Blautia schinkii]NSK25236.1 LTA synthase family protein [Blautia schinkii]NSK33431.1 LTA synthase family protein [Blautia schinkii]